MKHWILGLMFLIFFIPTNSFAGTNGSLTGIIKDKSGKGLQSVVVKIIGTKKGAISKPNGSFTITNIPAGAWTVEISLPSFKKKSLVATIRADETTNLGSIVLQELLSEEVVVIATRLVDPGTHEKKVEVSLQDVAGKENAQQAAFLTQGVLNDGGSGISIRGSRATDTRILVDGQDVSDQIGGGTGFAALAGNDLKYAPTTSGTFTNSVQVVRGNASAEYGNANGGVLNQTVNSGRTDKYEGVLRWKTDLPALWGSANNGLKALSTLENTFEFGIGGPVPGLDGSTFYVAATYFEEKYRVMGGEYRGSGIDAKDAAGNSLGHIPNTNSEKRNITGRLPIKLTDEIKVQLGATWGLTTLSQGTWAWLYASQPAMTFKYNEQTGLNDTTMLSTISHGTAHQNVINNFIYSYYIRLNHELNATSFYDATFSYNNNISNIGKRKIPLGAGSPVVNGVAVDPSKVSSELPGASFFGGYDIYEPADNLSVDGSSSKFREYFISNAGGLRDRVIDIYQPLSGIIVADGDVGRSRTDISNEKLNIKNIPNSETGYVEGGADLSGTNNAYGLTNTFRAYGNTPGGFEMRQSSFLQFQGTYQAEFEVSADLKHGVKAGVDTRYFTLRRYDNGLPESSTPFFDVFDDRFGGDIYSANDDEKARGSKPKHSLITSAFVEDQISYKGIIITPMLRLDAFDPSTSYALDPTLLASPTKEATMKFQLNPRLFIAYPIGDRSVFSIAYGKYSQVPIFSSLYDNTTTHVTRGNAIVGNPDLSPEKTDQFDVSYQTQLTDNLALDVSLFYKDVYGQSGYAFVPDNRFPYTLISNGEYGNVRGLELAVRKTLSQNIEFGANYTLQYAQGTSSSVGTNYGIILAGADQFTGQKIFPLTEYPFSYDRRHRLNANLGFKWGSSEGPSIGGLKFLQNSTFNFTGFFQSGAPFTLLDLKGNQASDFNGERYPSLTNVDLHISRRIFLSDIFGESLGTTTIEVFADIINLFNRTEPILLFDRTKDPDNDGQSLYKQQGEFPNVIWYSTPDAANANSIASTQYDNAGNRLYNINADINKDGAVTQYEQFQKYLQYVKDATKRKLNYQYPRQVYFGVVVRF